MKNFVKEDWLIRLIFLLVVILAGVVVWQYKINKRLTRPPSPFPYQFYDAGNGDIIGGYVSAKGTWESNLKLAYQYSMDEIDCWKQWDNCIVSEAYTTGDKRIGGLNLINTDNTYYEIKSWDNNKIIAKNTAMCAENVLTVDRKLEKVTIITTPINQETKACKSGAKLLGDVEVQTNVLIDGSKKWIDEFITNKN